MGSQLKLFPFNSLVFVFHLLQLFLCFFLFFNEVLLFASEVDFLVLQSLHFFGVKLDEVSVFHHFGVAMGDFLVQNDVVLSESPLIGFGICADFVGCFQGVVQAFVDFLNLSLR